MVLMAVSTIFIFLFHGGWACDSSLHCFYEFYCGYVGLYFRL